MKHTNIMRNVATGIQHVLQQESVPVEAPVVVQEPQVNHVENEAQYNQHQLAFQTQQIQVIIQAMHL